MRDRFAPSTCQSLSPWSFLRLMASCSKFLARVPCLYAPQTKQVDRDDRDRILRDKYLVTIFRFSSNLVVPVGNGLKMTLFRFDLTALIVIETNKSTTSASVAISSAASLPTLSCWKLQQHKSRVQTAGLSMLDPNK